jgi:methyl-accepting chemotaxis protein
MLVNLRIAVKLGLISVIMALILVTSLMLVDRNYAPLATNAKAERGANVAAATMADAYQHWTLADDQSNMYVALIALRDEKQHALAETTFKQATDARAAVEPLLAKVEPLIGSNKDRAMLTQVRTDLAKYDTFMRAMRTKAVAGDVSGAVRAVTVDNSEVSDALTKAFEALCADERADAASANAQMSSAASSGSALIVGLVAGGVVIIGLLMFGCVRVITVPLGKLTRVAARLSHGDVDVEELLPAPAGDELGMLSRSFRDTVRYQRHIVHASEAISMGDLTATSIAVGSDDRLGMSFDVMLANLRALIAGVAMASKSLAAASGEASAAAHQSTAAVGEIAQAIDLVAAGAQDQAGTITDTTAAIQGLSRTAEEIAMVATHQAESIALTTAALSKLDEGIGALSTQGAKLTAAAREASSEATSGTAAVTETAGTIAQLKSVSANAAGAMASLEERSSQVEEIVETIEDIADQSARAQRRHRSGARRRARTWIRRRGR